MHILLFFHYILPADETPVSLFPISLLKYAHLGFPELIVYLQGPPTAQKNLFMSYLFVTTYNTNRCLQNCMQELHIEALMQDQAQVYCLH